MDWESLQPLLAFVSCLVVFIICLLCYRYGVKKKYADLNNRANHILKTYPLAAQYYNIPKIVDKSTQSHILALIYMEYSSYEKVEQKLRKKDIEAKMLQKRKNIENEYPHGYAIITADLGKVSNACIVAKEYEIIQAEALYWENELKKSMVKKTSEKLSPSEFSSVDELDKNISSEDNDSKNNTLKTTSNEEKLISTSTCKVDKCAIHITKKIKENSTQIIEYLKENEIKYFYHFTDITNLSLIKESGGLYSRRYCEVNGIAIPRAGGNDLSYELDKRCCLDDYVHLSFCESHPMAYKLYLEGATLVLLRINIEVATFLETKFSNMNTTDQFVKCGNTIADLKRVNISATQRYSVNRKDKDYSEHQAECLIKTFLPIEYIENINNPQKMYE